MPEQHDECPQHAGRRLDSITQHHGGGAGGGPHRAPARGQGPIGKEAAAARLPCATLPGGPATGRERTAAAGRPIPAAEGIRAAAIGSRSPREAPGPGPRTTPCRHPPHRPSRRLRRGRRGARPTSSRDRAPARAPSSRTPLTAHQRPAAPRSRLPPAVEPGIGPTGGGARVRRASAPGSVVGIRRRQGGTARGHIRSGRCGEGRRKGNRSKDRRRLERPMSASRTTTRGGPIRCTAHARPNSSRPAGRMRGARRTRAAWPWSGPLGQ